MAVYLDSSVFTTFLMSMQPCSHHLDLGDKEHNDKFVDQWRDWPVEMRDMVFVKNTQNEDAQPVLSCPSPNYPSSNVDLLLPDMMASSKEDVIAALLYTSTNQLHTHEDEVNYSQFCLGLPTDARQAAEDSIYHNISSHVLNFPSTESCPSASDLVCAESDMFSPETNISLASL